MKKPSNYDNTSAGGFTPIALGGHLCTIKEVEETQSKTGRPMIVVYLDTSEDDTQPFYFSKAFADDIRPDKKWPIAGRKYILTEDKDGNCSRSFKQFTTAFEKSNNAEVVWGDAFCSQFAGKAIGAVYGEVENEYNGKVTMRHELRWFCDIDKAREADIPSTQYLNGTASAPVRPGAQTDVFAPVVDSELPFN